MERVIYNDLGSIDYKKAWDYQQELLASVVDQKRLLRNGESAIDDRRHYLLFCDHPPVYTLGKSGSLDNLLLSEKELEEKGIDFYKINRGGDITFHGLGQLVGYPIFDLDGFFTDVHRYVRTLEEVIIRMLAENDIQAGRVEGYTGVWLKNPDRKICAIGVHLSRWVTMHGFALNVNTDLNYFDNIVPCGIDESDKGLTSMHLELGRAVDKVEVKERLKYHFMDLFGFEFVDELKRK